MNHIIIDKRAEEMSASFGLGWFLQNIVIIILLAAILGFGLFFILRWLTG
jgi:hypothetical protein